MDKSEINECEHRPLQIVCGDNSALLYLSRIRSGSSGHCVLYGKSWLTPNEFQAISGRKAAKDWKRSIKHNGKSLKILICTKTLTLEPPSCICEKCIGISTEGNGNEIGKQTRSEVDRPRETVATIAAEDVTLNLTTNEQVATPCVARGRRKQLVAAKRTKRTKRSRLAEPLSCRRNTRSTSREEQNILTCGKTGMVIHGKRRGLSSNMSASPQANRRKSCPEKLSDRNIKRNLRNVTASRMQKGKLLTRMSTRTSRIATKSRYMVLSKLNGETTDDNEDDCVALINFVKADKVHKIGINVDNRSCLSEVDRKEIATTVCDGICNSQNNVEPKRQNIISPNVIDVPRSLVDKTDDRKPTEEVCGDKNDSIKSGPVTLQPFAQPDTSSADSAESGHRVDELPSNHHFTDTHKKAELQTNMPRSDKLSYLSTQKESRLLSIIQELKTCKQHLLANRTERKQVATQTKCDFTVDAKVQYGCSLENGNVKPRTHVDANGTTVNKNDGFSLSICPMDISLTHSGMTKRDKPTAAVIGQKWTNTENRETIDSDHVGEQKAIERVNDTCSADDVRIAPLSIDKNTIIATLLNHRAKTSHTSFSEKVSRLSQNSDTKQQVENYLTQKKLFDGVQHAPVADVLDLRVSKQDKRSEIVPCANSGRQINLNKIKNSTISYQYGRPLPKNMRTWSVDDVHCFVLSMPGCAHFAKVFRDHSITGRLLRNLSVTQLMRVLRIDQRIAEAVRWRVDKILLSSRDRATSHRVYEVKSRPTRLQVATVVPYI